MTTAQQPRRIRAVAWISLGVLVLVGALLWIGGDRWWPILPLLYGPRIVGVILLFPLALSIRGQPRRGLSLLMIGVGILCWMILGFRVGPARLLPNAPPNLRVASYNVAGRMTAANQLVLALDSMGINLAALVECPEGLLAPNGWYLERAGELCLLSRDSLPPLTPIPTPSLDGAAVANADISIGKSRVRVGLVHLGTPHGIAMMFNDKSEIPKLGPMVRENTRQRNLDSELASRFMQSVGDGPLLVLGDFNLPVESNIYREYWGEYTDSHNAGGLGLGSTWVYGLYRIRIDHILVKGGIRVIRSWVGPDLGSDHLPVIADLLLKGNQ